MLRWLHNFRRSPVEPRLPELASPAEIRAFFPGLMAMAEGIAEERPNGNYSCPRECTFCGFTTLSRDEFWLHIEREHPHNERES